MPWGSLEVQQNFEELRVVGPWVRPLARQERMGRICRLVLDFGKMRRSDNPHAYLFSGYPQLALSPVSLNDKP